MRSLFIYTSDMKTTTKSSTICQALYVIICLDLIFYFDFLFFLSIFLDLIFLFLLDDEEVCDYGHMMLHHKFRI